MLILKIDDEIADVKKGKKRFYKKTKNTELKRYAININSKTVTVLELRTKDLERQDVLTLLKIYSGKVLVPAKYADDKILEEYLFNPKEYYQRSLLSSLINQIKTVNTDWKNLCIKIEKFSPYKEFYELVRISKTVVIITSNNAFTEKFKNDCYYEYGAIVSVKNDEISIKKDVFLDLEAIDNNRKIMVDVKGKGFVLYSDVRYFENFPDYEKLLPFDIEHNIICAAFSNK